MNTGSVTTVKDLEERLCALLIEEKWGQAGIST